MSFDRIPCMSKVMVNANWPSLTLQVNHVLRLRFLTIKWPSLKTVRGVKSLG